jgi:hypothetical protein
MTNIALIHQSILGGGRKHWFLGRRRCLVKKVIKIEFRQLII